jgi:hypothetical protein
MALALIDKQDAFEIVRDQIAAILVAELANQQALAPGAGKDPLDYTLSVYVERDLPVEQWLNSGPANTVATAPIVSIWMESANIDTKSTSNAKGEQHFEITYNLDVLARGFASNDPGGGHFRADRDARLRCHAATRLVRNILSAGPNRFLGLRGIVWAWPQFENMELGPAPLEDIETGISVWLCRCRLRVKVTETSPLEGEETLEQINIDVSDDGGVILSVEAS